MKSAASSAAVVLAVFLLFSAASAFNITKLLSQYSDFTNFNDYLKQTKLADQINSRQTITILAVDNGAISSLSGKPIDVVKKILSVHVILDYYDLQKLSKLSSGNTTLLTTLFQASGGAVNQEGFVKVEIVNKGEIVFGSGVNGAPIDTKMVKSVVAQPYNISVLQVSSIIQVPGIDSKPAASPPPSVTPTSAPKKSPAPSAETPAQADEPVTAPVVAPVADAPESDAPDADDSPASSPPAGDDSSDAVSPGPGSNSSASRGSLVGVAVIMGLISSLLAV